MIPYLLYKSKVAAIYKPYRLEIKKPEDVSSLCQFKKGSSNFKFLTTDR